MGMYISNEYIFIEGTMVCFHIPMSSIVRFDCVSHQSVPMGQSQRGIILYKWIQVFTYANF